MADQSIFGNEPNTQTTSAQGTTAGTNTNNSNPLETLLAGIKNESGVQKYATIEEALKALQHSQAYIPTLKNESEQAKRQAEEATRAADELKAQLKRQEELERTVQELTQRIANSQNTTGQQVTPEQIAEIVNSTLTGREAASTAKQNQTAVVAAMTQKFGEKAKEMYVAAATEMGMTVAEFDALAAKNPKVVLKAVGVSDVQPKANNGSPVQTRVNTAGFQPSQETFVKRAAGQQLGATHKQMQEEFTNSKRMVEELHSQGLEIADLVKPSEYFKHFG